MRGTLNGGVSPIKLPIILKYSQNPCGVLKVWLTTGGGNCTKEYLLFKVLFIILWGTYTGCIL